MTKVVLDNLRREFGKTVAVDNLSLEIKDKHFVSILGPSGCGKTTILRMVAGLLPPTKGRIFFDDIDVTELPPQDRKVGLVSQDYAIFPHMNGFDNIAWGLKIRKMKLKDIRSKISEISELLDIKDLLETMPSRMTQSELQRVALARTLVTNPNVLLLDEPLSNLDATLRARMRAELKKLQAQIEQTVIYVTHDQIEAMSLSDEIALMNFGKLQQYDTPANIYHKPKNKFVAGFIGSPPMNFIDCSITEENGKIYLDNEAFKLDVTHLTEDLKRGRSGSEVILGVRPEDLKVSNSPLKGYFKFSVYTYEPVGADSIVDIIVGENIIRALTSEAFVPKVGNRIYVRFEVDKIHIIDKKTENLIV
ncbi:MAG: ABC transporter ATP-binding protein [Candidatus Bathyarchaeia archaeon]